jgi:ferritin-like metal-binding protein YciE
MPERTLDEQLVAYLTDAHGIEQQALQQLRAAPGLAGDPVLAGLYAEHLAETEGHERLARERLEARGALPSRLEDLVMRAGGSGFVLFARAQPDTPGKLAAHAYSYEHLELAAYELLAEIAGLAGDPVTAETARRIRDEERHMGERLAAAFDRTVDASLAAVGAREDPARELTRYLQEAHAIEVQARRLLTKAEEVAGEPELAAAYRDHLAETEGHEHLLDERLAARDASPSTVKDIGLRLGAVNWGAFFAAQPDTPLKLAAFAFAFEHLEIAGYEQLRRVAERAGDTATADAAERISSEERAAAGRLHGLFPRAVDATLAATVAFG